MNKQQEIDILTATADALTGDTYTGQWLREQLPHIISAIRSDLCPEPAGVLTLTQAQARAGQIVTDALSRAKDIFQKARDDAHKETQTAARQVESIRDQARAALRESLARLS